MPAPITTGGDVRHLIGATAVAAAAQLGMLAPGSAQSAKTTLPLIKPGTNISFGPLKHVDAGGPSVVPEAWGEAARLAPVRLTEHAAAISAAATDRRTSGLTSGGLR